MGMQSRGGRQRRWSEVSRRGGSPRSALQTEYGRKRKKKMVRDGRDKWHAKTTQALTATTMSKGGAH